MAGLEVAVLQTEGVQLLKAGIDLLMHRGILGGDLGQFINQTGTALVVVALRVLETLAVLGRGLGSLGGTSVGVNRAGALHVRGRGGTRDPSSLAVGRGGILLLGRDARRSLRGAGLRARLGSGPLARNVVVNTFHVVMQVPSTGESKSRH